jgi:hypothetical protein
MTVLSQLILVLVQMLVSVVKRIATVTLQGRREQAFEGCLFGEKPIVLV